MFEDTPFTQSLDSAYTLDYPADKYVQNMNLVSDALKQLGRNTDGLVGDEYPSYFDDLLMQLIDATPLSE